MRTELEKAIDDLTAINDGELLQKEKVLEWLQGYLPIEPIPLKEKGLPDARQFLIKQLGMSDYQADTIYSEFIEAALKFAILYAAQQDNEWHTEQQKENMWQAYKASNTVWNQDDEGLRDEFEEWYNNRPTPPPLS